MTTLKSIALELLQKYEETQTSLIFEYSGDIDKSMENLDAEVAKYRELIAKYAEQSGWEEMTVPCEHCGHDMTFKIAVCGEPTSPCDLCRFNPPSSADGKPCTMCPVERREDEF